MADPRPPRRAPAEPPASPEPTEEPRAAHDVELEAPAAGGLVAGRIDWRQAFLVPALAVVTALAVGALVIVFSDAEVLREWAGLFVDPGEALSVSGRVIADAYSALFRSALGSPRAIAETAVVATPLILAGLSVALAFRAGLFNIGAEGQITAGAMLAALAGFSFPGLPGPLHLALVVAAGFAGGAAWGAIPGVLKAKTGAHEVITTIMLNFVAGSLALFALSTELYQRPGRTDPISKPVDPAFPTLFGLRLHVGLIVALAVAAAVAWLVNRTTIGFEFRAVGANPWAARAAGMSPGRTMILAMMLAGGLAGLAGANQLASVTTSLTPGFSSGMGFDAIALALLGRARPSGVVAAAFLFGVLRAGSRGMQAATQTPIDIIVVIQALVIAFIAAPALVRAIYRIRARRVEGPEAFTKGWAG